MYRLLFGICVKKKNPKLVTTGQQRPSSVTFNSNFGLTGFQHLKIDLSSYSGVYKNNEKTG